MKVYIKPRQSQEDPVLVTGLHIGPEDSLLASNALRASYNSARCARTQGKPRARPLFQPGSFLSGAEAEYRNAHEQYRQYIGKMVAYENVIAELEDGPGQEPDGLALGEMDTWPPATIYEGIMFGLGELQREGYQTPEQIRAIEDQITYVEGDPQV